VFSVSPPGSQVRVRILEQAVLLKSIARPAPFELMQS
jgi:hypothetical protein